MFLQFLCGVFEIHPVLITVRAEHRRGQCEFEAEGVQQVGYFHCTEAKTKEHPYLQYKLADIKTRPALSNFSG